MQLADFLVWKRQAKLFPGQTKWKHWVLMEVLPGCETNVPMIEFDGIESHTSKREEGERFFCSTRSVVLYEDIAIICKRYDFSNENL